MPRGFLIKRKKHLQETWFSRRGSEESDQCSEPERISPSLASSAASDEALNLSTKNNNNNVFSEGLNLVTTKTTSEAPSPPPSEKSTLSPIQKQSESQAVNLCKIYLEASKKVQQLVDKERLSEEFNNNFLRHPLADFNRETFQHYLPNGLPSSAPLSISTGSNWSPFYLAAFDHLSVTSSPSSSSHGSSPRSAPPLAPLPSPQQTQNPAPQGKKRSHATATGSSKASQKPSKKMKAVRKIEFNDSSSPVSGTYIREESDDDGIRVVSGDIDTNLNIVEVTPEAEAELAKIENKIGEYRCRLCKDMFDNAFGLAQHRCSRIVHVEYRCPECDKVFNCSANLASHRRWHKPRQPTNGQTKLPKLLPHVEGDTESREPQDAQFPCTQCGKHFKRQAYLRKHMATHSTSAPAGEEAAPRPPPLPLPHPLACRLCGSQAADHLALEEHIRLRHRTDMFSCKICSASCFNLSGLSEHVRKCHAATHPPLVMLPPLSRPC